MSAHPLAAIFARLTGSSDLATEDSSGRRLSYAELGMRVESLRKKISKWSRGPVGILSHRKIETVAAVLACAAELRPFVPLGSKRDGAELAGVLRRTGCQGFLFDADEGSHELVKSGLPALSLDLSFEEGAGFSEVSPGAERDILYFITTSGTTGTPKIVPITLENYRAYLGNFSRNFSMPSRMRWAWAFELNFDPALGYLFPVLASGGVICPFERRDHWDLEKFLRDLEVEAWASAPSLASVLLSRVRGLEGTALREAHFMGENLTERAVAEWRALRPDLRIVNLYGPAECTVNTSFAHIDPGQEPAAVDSSWPI